MSKQKIFLLLVIIIGLFIAFAPSEPVSQPDRTNSLLSTSNRSEKELITDGIKAKQAAFESKNPEYPDAEKIVYLIENETTEPELHPADQELWSIVRSLSPNTNALESISEFEVYYDEDDDTLASVASVNDDNSKWVYSINYISVTSFDDLVPTIVHEYGHVISLQDDQTTTESEQEGITESCQSLLVVEGCLAFTSYLNKFNTRFWEGAKTPKADRSPDEAAEHYEANKDDYVSDYATTNQAEDFSESFMTYVLDDLPQADSTLIKDQKVLFFDDFTELKDYRATARQTISNWAN